MDTPPREEVDELRLKIIGRVKELVSLTTDDILNTHNALIAASKGARRSALARKLNMLRVRVTALLIARCELRLTKSTGRKCGDRQHVDKIYMSHGWGHIAGSPPLTLEITRDLHTKIAQSVVGLIDTPFEAYLELTLSQLFEKAVKNQVRTILESTEERLPDVRTNIAVGK